MSWNPNLIFYACIAKDTTILAEFNSKDADLGDLAKKCLEKTPPFHSIFSHTVHGETYMFFILDPFVYFGIFDESLEKPECLLFLKSVKNAFTSMIDNCSSGMMKQRLYSPNWHCFQGEFSPVFQQLLASNLEFDATSSAADLKDDHRESLNSVRRKNKGSTDSSSMKKRFFGDADKDGAEEGKLDLDNDDGSVSSGTIHFIYYCEESINSRTWKMGFEEEPKLLLLFSQRFSRLELEGGFTPPPDTYTGAGATIPFQWEEAPGKPRCTTTSDPAPQGVRCLNLPPRLLMNTKEESIQTQSPTSVLDEPYSGMSSPGRSKWKMMMGLRKMMMCKGTSSHQLRSWSLDSFTYISSSSRDGDSSSSLNDVFSDSLDSNVKNNKVSTTRGLIFFNKTAFSILENMNQSINQVVPWRR
ncbi:unnamed protein product [Lactuca virosa]|uniref:Longin domain-containing protein n=1 Tax=Lactuca virosa TaxID=75947 RepID=A0AAU9MVW2_9ASTR|nr:unnamed protein product [Lactuca virosa]